MCKTSFLLPHLYHVDKTDTFLPVQRLGSSSPIVMSQSTGYSNPRSLPAKKNLNFSILDETCQVRGL